MLSVAQAQEYLDTILRPQDYDDFCFNGVQIEGISDVSKIAYGVSLNDDFIEKSIEQGVQLLLVHHGIFGKDFINLHGVKKKRIEKIIKNGLTLMSYHLPLDMNIPYGNNISVLKKLKLNYLSTIGFGMIGVYEKPISFYEFEKKLYETFPHSELQLYRNRETISTVGVLTGDGSGEIEQYEGLVDTFITGSEKEYTRNWVKESGMNFINAGHYNTEIFGISNIANLLKIKYGADIIFIDVPNNL
jgi:dinuclear metal center YbgI/SA1388 family protein